MKKFNKLIALACVATMVISPMTALADTTTSLGDSVIENDNSKAPVYTAVQLPTINDGTYDFEIDRDKLLDQYDYEGEYDEHSHVYFNAVLDAATLTPKAANTDTKNYALYKKVFTVDTTQADAEAATEGDFLAALGTDDADLTNAKAEIVKPANAIYYVWQPVDYDGTTDKADEAKGHYVKIDADNIVNIVEVAVGGTTETPTYTYVLREDHDAGDFIWDGNIYVEDYELLDAATAANYITATKAADAYTLALKDSSDPEGALYLGTTTIADSGNTTVYAAADLANDVVYTPATYQHKDISDAATVENKSTTPIAVKVEINVTNDKDITYAEADDVSDTENASLYLAIKSGSNIAAVKDSNAVAYYVLNGADNDTMVYQLSGTVLETGSHDYRQFELPGAVYDKVSFEIVADVNESDDADEAWQKYIDSLTTAENPNTKPTIEVVYSWETVTQVGDTNEYTDGAGNSYTTDGVTGWAPAHTHTFTDYTDLTCDGEDCDYERTSQITNPITLMKNGAGTKYYASLGAGAVITSAKVYDANEYASKGASASVVEDIASISSISDTGSYNIMPPSDLEEAVTEAGTYVIAVVTESNGTFTYIYTVQ